MYKTIVKGTKQFYFVLRYSYENNIRLIWTSIMTAATKAAPMQYAKFHHGSKLYNDILAATKATYIMYMQFYSYGTVLFHFFLYRINMLDDRNICYNNSHQSCTNAIW